MVHKRRDFLITFTVLCLAMCACSGLQYLGSAFYLMVRHWVFSLERGGGRLLSGLFSSPWTGVLVQYVFSIGLPFLAVIPMTWFLRSDRRPAQKLSAEVWVSALFMALGLGYIFNFLGVFLDSFISIFTGVPAGDMNPVMDALDALTPGMVIYTCLVAPFMEELLFRGVLLRKARRFGDRTAVVFTAVMFGLMHGNLNQFLYAVVIGLVLGYLAVRTNRILYNVLLHFRCCSRWWRTGSMRWGFPGRQRRFRLPVFLWSCSSSRQGSISSSGTDAVTGGRWGSRTECRHRIKNMCI